MQMMNTTNALSSMERLHQRQKSYIRVILSIATTHDLNIQVADVDTDSLYWDIDTDNMK